MSEGNVTISFEVDGDTFERWRRYSYRAGCPNLFTWIVARCDSLVTHHEGQSGRPKGSTSGARNGKAKGIPEHILDAYVMAVARKVREAREAADVSQEELATAIEGHKTSIANLESLAWRTPSDWTRRRRPSLHMIIRIALALQRMPCELLP